MTVCSLRHSRTLSALLSVLLFLPSVATFAQLQPRVAGHARQAAHTQKPLSALKVGDIIPVRSIHTGKVELKRVTFAGKHTYLFLLSVQTISKGKAQVLTCPPDQQFKLSSGRMVPAARLAIGNSIVTRAGPAPIRAIAQLHKPGGFVVCDVRVGPAPTARRPLLRTAHSLPVQFADYHQPRVSRTASDMLLAQSVAGGTPNPFLFAGQQYDSNLGIYYLRARYYAPTLGRFLSRDPYQGDDDNPITQNPYIYAGNNPVTCTDPGGRFEGLGGTLTSIAAIGTLSATALLGTPIPANAPALDSPIYYDNPAQDVDNGVFVIFTSEIGGRAASYGLSKAFGIIGGALATRALASKLENGVSFVLNEKKYLDYIKGKNLIGTPDGQFCTTTPAMDAAISETGAEPVALGQKLGLNFQPGDKLYRVDIQDPLSLNPRVPDASLSGANQNFVPGGKTSGGLPEFVIDQIPASQFTVYPIN